MNTSTLAGLTLAAIAIGITLGAALAWALFRNESEESPAARRAALGRVSRVRAESALLAEEERFGAGRVRIRGSWAFEPLQPGRVYDSAPTLSVLEAALAEGRHVFAGPNGAIVTAPPGTLTRAPEGFRPMGFMELRDRIEITRRKERESWECRQGEAQADRLGYLKAWESEQELARRRAQSGGTFDVPSQPPDPFWPVCGNVASNGPACTLPAGHACVHQAGSTYWSRGGEAA